MRAWIYHGNSDIRLEELPEPQPGPGEVAVRIAFNGLCGSDLHEYFDGPMFIPIQQPNPVTGHHGPVTLGHEASGTITALGDGVEDFEVGTRVAIEPIVRTPGDDAHYNIGAAFYGLMKPGFLADTAVVGRKSIHPLPTNVSLHQGALTEPLSVAWHAAAKTGLGRGQAAIVFGGGPIGIGTALSLRARNVDHVLVVEPAARRRTLLADIGFDTADPTDPDFPRRLAEIAPHGFDGAVDSAGAGAALTAGINALAPQGVLVIVAIHTKLVTIDPNLLLAAERTIVGSMGYRDDFPAVLAAQAAGAFPTDGWVETIPFDNLIDDGLNRLHRGEAVKILVEVAPE
jgi:(R,R)-butanediol dehydrogenase/meso-butanediol dehydrogenase/diacetyl reductase